MQRTLSFHASSLSSWRESGHPQENRPRNDPCAVNVPEGTELYIYFYACVNADPFWRIPGFDFYRRRSLRVKPIKMERLKSRFAFIRYILPPLEVEIRNRKGGKSFLSLSRRRKTSSAGVMRDETALLFRQIERFLEEFSTIFVRFLTGSGRFLRQKSVGNQRRF